MMQQMDARGFNVYSSVRLRGVLQEQPVFSAFWKRLPALGHIAVYHRSWYYLKNANEMADKAEDDSKYPVVSFEHINNFEKMLTDDNYLVLKVFPASVTGAAKEKYRQECQNTGQSVA